MRGVIHVQLPDGLRRVARVRAAQQDETVSQYVAALIRQDAERAGVTDLVDDQDGKEGGDERQHAG